MRARRGLELLALLWLVSGCRPRESFAVLPLAPAPALEVPLASGGVFRLGEQRGKVVVVTFGYTSCPDVCPTTLSQLRHLGTRLGGAARDLEVVFVSVDPERDSAEAVETYAHAFGTRFTGLRLEPEPLAPVLAAWHVTATRRYPEPERYREHPFAASSPYTVDHTGAYFLVDKRGRLRLRLPYTVDAERLREEVARLLDEDEELTLGPRVERARARVTPSHVGAVYFTLVNGTAQEDRLLSVESTSAGRVELHEVRTEGELVQMRHRPEGFALPARARLELEPGGKHLMLYAVPPATRRVDLTLHFEKARPLSLTLPVVEPDADAL
jgi:protein SCO1